DKATEAIIPAVLLYPEFERQGFGEKMWAKTMQALRERRYKEFYIEIEHKRIGEWLKEMEKNGEINLTKTVQDLSEWPSLPSYTAKFIVTGHELTGSSPLASESTASTIVSKRQKSLRRMISLEDVERTMEEAAKEAIKIKIKELKEEKAEALRDNDLAKAEEKEKEILRVPETRELTCGFASAIILKKLYYEFSIFSLVIEGETRWGAPSYYAFHI
ncbi:MAG: hypothetical protein AABY26_02210, partial [Nanoarchaeota archaeon]